MKRGKGFALMRELRISPPTCAMDVEDVAQAAHVLSLLIRDIDPAELLTQLTDLNRRSPVWMAQIVMALAAWTNPDESESVRGDRVEAISKWRTT